MLSFKPEENTTDIKGALEYLHHTIKRKSIAFLISDFIDDGYDKIMNIVGKKHDLIGVVLKDPRESEIPRSGLIKFKDAETGQLRYVDTSSKKVQQMSMETLQFHDTQRKQIFLKSRLDSINIDISESYIKPLANFFRKREKQL